MAYEQTKVKRGAGTSRQSCSRPGPVPVNTTTPQSPHLQHCRAVGNEALQRMLESGTIQPKLKIGQPNDKYEQEADHVADQVMRMPEKKGSLGKGGSESPLIQQQSKECPECNEKEEEEEIQTKPISEQITPLVQRQVESEEEEPEKEEEEEESLRAKHISNKSPPMTPGLQSQIQSIKGGGQPLPKSVSNYFEPRFGRDFSNVRVHTDIKAADVAKSINAKAFTTGKDVMLDAGQYSPESLVGKQLLAHELTHVVQQGQATDTIQRSLKFEFQTRNHVWAVKKSGAPDPRLLPRKYSATTVGFKEGSGEERGDKPAYLAVGQKGGPARPKGHVEFVKAKGPRVMEEAKSGIDATKDAQFIKEYRFKTQINVIDIIDKPVARGQLELVDETDNAKLPAMTGRFNPNTFEFKYSNADGTQLDVHLNEDRVFKKKHVKLMKVGRGARSDIDENKAAQFIETWKVTEVATGTVDFLGKRAKVERVSVMNNAKDAKMKGLFNPNTWEKNYFLAADFKGDALSGSAKPLDVHMDTDGRLRKGRVQFMEKKKLAAAKEQTAIELQSETGGVLEFETPKWFRKWSELKERIQEAVDMTDAINSQRGTNKEVTDKKILDAIDEKKSTGSLGKVVEWPAAYSTDHLKKLRADKRRLLVQIVDDTWIARIQASEGIALSEYESLLKEHEIKWVKDIVIPSANSIFSTAFQAAKLKNSSLNESLFSDLKGFLQLILTYIVRAQVIDMTGGIAKATFLLMARTNFGSMYKELLNTDEQALFKTILGDPKKSSDNPILTELESPINTKRATKGLGALTLTRKSPFFFRKVGTHKKSATFGPNIYDWLVAITKGKDLLRGRDWKGISDSMGAKTVMSMPGDKDFRHAQFEIRGTISHGGTDHPAANWVSYAKDIFDSAVKRAADTPDDPTTPKVDETSKTSLKQ